VLRTTRLKAAAATAAMLVTMALLTGGCAGDAGVTTSETTETGGSVTTAVPTTNSSLPTTTSQDVPSTVPSLPADDGLTLEQVRSAEITGFFEGTVLTFTLVDGMYEGPAGGDDSSPVTVAMADAVAFGDLNGDGVNDAAVAFTVGREAGPDTDSSSAGAGGQGASQYVVALVSEGREPVAKGTHLVGQGARIDALSIAGGEIVVEGAVPGPEEPAGEPTVPITATLRLPLVEGSSWVLLHTAQTSETPDGDVRAIEITSPEPRAWVTGACVIEGTVSVSPFENNLVYAIYDEEMTELDMGPVAVETPGFGAPGTFELPVDLIELGCIGTIFVTISDLSAADGSILAMDSVELVNLAPT